MKFWEKVIGIIDLYVMELSGELVESIVSWKFWFVYFLG